MARKLTDLGSDLLAAILGKLPDTRSRLAAAAASKALWEASCLPGAWGGARLALDLDNWEKTPGILWFLNRRGKGLLRVELSLKPGTCSLTRTQERLAPLLARLPALQVLELHSQHLAVLSVVAASLPQLQQLAISPTDPQATPLLPDNLSSLQRLSCLQRLVVSLDPEYPLFGLGPLLGGIENLVSLTGLLLEYVDEPRYGAASAPEGKWSTQLTRLQRLQHYHDGLGLELPLELASLPELRSVFVGSCDWDWEVSGSVLCALRGLTSLTVLYDDEGASSNVPDPAGFKQALGSLQELRWELPAGGLHESGHFHLQGLTSLTVQGHLDLYACLLWSPVCRLQRLVLEDMAFFEETLDLAALSPLTSLTFLSVGGMDGLELDNEALLLPQSPCVARLQVLIISCAGVTCVPAELRQAGRLRRLDMRDPELHISRACVATLTGLRELAQLEVEVARDWRDRNNQRKGWDWESVRNLGLLQEARPDIRLVRSQDGTSVGGGDWL